MAPPKKRRAASSAAKKKTDNNTFASLGIEDDIEFSLSHSVMIEKIERIHRQKKALKILEEFRALDADNSGNLSKLEFLKLAKHVREFELLTDTELEAHFDNIDLDGSNEISITEFKDFYLNQLRKSKKTNRPFPLKSLAELKEESTYKYLRRYFYTVLFGGDSPEETSNLRNEYPESVWIGSVLATAVIVSTITFALETVHGWENWVGWDYFEIPVCAIFTIEYCLRLWAVNHRLQWMMRFTSIIDLLSWLPIWIMMIIEAAMAKDHKTTDLIMAFRTIRLVRLLRISRMESLENYFEIFYQTIKLSRYSFTMLILIFSMGVYVCGALAYAVERYYWLDCYDYVDEGECGGNCEWSVQGGYCGATFKDIFHAMYWAIITMTTLGYGDIAPTSNMGFAVSIITVCFGLLILAFAVNIIGSCFDEAFTRFLEAEQTKLKEQLRAEAEDAGNGKPARQLSMRSQQTAEMPLAFEGVGKEFQIATSPNNLSDPELVEVGEYLKINQQKLAAKTTKLTSFLLQCNKDSINDLTPRIIQEVEIIYGALDKFMPKNSGDKL